MKSKYDLHIHSNFSDGEYTIDELIDMLKKENIKVFSICDHDNIESIKYLNNLELKDIKYISGVEISSYYKKMGIHILGYYIDGNKLSLKRLLTKINLRRKKRMKEILKKIRVRNGIVLNNDDLDELMSANNIGKKNLSKILIKNNLGNNYLEIRDNYLTNLHCKTSYRANIKKVCKAVKNANGIPVLAHPKEMELRYGIKLENVIKDLIKCGIKGIEVYHSIHTDKDIERYLSIANKYDLLISGGSDFHTNKSKKKLGILSKEDYVIPYENFSILNMKK